MFTIILSAVLCAAPTGEEVYAALPIEQREPLVQHYRDTLAALEQDAREKTAAAESARKAVKGTRRGRQRDAAEAKAAEAEQAASKAIARRDDLRTNRPPLVPELVLEKGRFGRLPQVFCEQRVNDGEAIVRVNQFAGRDFIDGRPIERRTRFWLKSELVKDAVDDRLLDTPGIWIVTGTKTYNTVGAGSSTVLVVEPFTWPESKSEPEPAADPPAAEES